MVVARPHHRYSFDDYLAVEEMGPVRHEFLDGAIFAMGGGNTRARGAFGRDRRDAWRTLAWSRLPPL